MHHNRGGGRRGRKGGGRRRKELMYGTCLHYIPYTMRRKEGKEAEDKGDEEEKEGEGDVGEEKR